MKKRSGRQFFEAFGQLDEPKKSRAWWRKRPPDEEKKAAASSQKPQKNADRRRRGDPTVPSARIDLTFSREALVMMFVVLAGLVAGAFASGYAWGHSRRPAYALNSPADAGAPLAAAARDYDQAALSIRSGEMIYSLQLGLQALSKVRAQQLADDIHKTFGYKAFCAKQPAGNDYHVYVGGFSDYRIPQARAFKEEVSKLVYQNEQWFKSCSWWQVPNP